MPKIAAVILFAFFISGACGSGSDVPREEWLRRLQNAIRSKTESRETNLRNSRTLEQALDQDALKNMMRFQVKKELGSGQSCGRHPECLDLGFQADDLYYAVGEGDETKIGKRPVLIVGFDQKGNVIRVWNLRIH
ncbi:MAG: hypothetical protein JXA30_20895 [Deltaproteobacteria bacterium]|nr:hypothetical protein [Deltaproteobacteria bacterium]